MALAIVKREPAEGAKVSPTLPARLEDVSTTLLEQIAALAERQDRLGAAQEERLARIERASRRGRWRR